MYGAEIRIMLQHKYPTNTTEWWIYMMYFSGKSKVNIGLQTDDFLDFLLDFDPKYDSRF